SKEGREVFDVNLPGAVGAFVPQNWGGEHPGHRRHPQRWTCAPLCNWRHRRSAGSRDTCHMDIELDIEGVPDGAIADAIREKVRHLRHQIVLPGDWRVTIAPS